MFPQQFEAALRMISAASGNFESSAPGGMFSAVAVKSPKPGQKFLSSILLGAGGSSFFTLVLWDSCLKEFHQETRKWPCVVSYI